MQTDLFSEGVNLMTLGMGFVFSFLVFLVWAVTFMSNLLTRWFPEQEPQPVAKRATQTPSSQQQDAELVAVMAAAIHHKRIQQNTL